ncbi:MAG: type II secretion system protein [Clostridia bacterium]|nr:type II secretion system protein [Clostridia bacterium]
MFKQQKGITLIALVITIIVLLILAGITIAMLTGSDSAPAKANEAKQKQDIGAAKDQVYMVAQNAQLEYYDTTYVKAGATAASGATNLSTANTAAGTYVGTKVSNEYTTAKTVGDAKIEKTTNAEGDSCTVVITTRDYTCTGHIAQDGGALSWSTIATH